MADVYDPQELGWLRYDANFNDGIGVPIEAPNGRAKHAGHEYYATALPYVRIPHLIISQRTYCTRIPGAPSRGRWRETALRCSPFSRHRRNLDSRLYRECVS